MRDLLGKLGARSWKLKLVDPSTTSEMEDHPVGDVDAAKVEEYVVRLNDDPSAFWFEKGPVVTVGEDRQILDGRHRVAAANKAGQYYLDLNVPMSFVEERLDGGRPPVSLEAIAEDARSLLRERRETDDGIN